MTTTTNTATHTPAFHGPMTDVEHNLTLMAMIANMYRKNGDRQIKAIIEFRDTYRPGPDVKYSLLASKNLMDAAMVLYRLKAVRNYAKPLLSAHLENLVALHSAGVSDLAIKMVIADLFNGNATKISGILWAVKVLADPNRTVKR